MFQSYLQECLISRDAPDAMPNAVWVMNSVAPDWSVASQIITIDKIRRAIRSYQPFKGAGTDGIFPAILQRAGPLLGLRL